MAWRQGGLSWNTRFAGTPAQWAMVGSLRVSSVAVTAEGQGFCTDVCFEVPVEPADRKGELVGYLPSATQIPELRLSRRKKALKKKKLKPEP